MRRVQPRKEVPEKVEAGSGRTRPLASGIVEFPRPVPRSHQEAAQRLTDPLVCRSVGFRNAAVKCRPDGVDPAVWRFGRDLRREFALRHYPIFVAFMRPGWDYQAARYVLGETDVPPGQSVHDGGFALDLEHFGRGRALESVEWAVIGALGAEVSRRSGDRMVWGPELVGFGTFGPWHWERRDWRPAPRVLRKRGARP